MEKGYNKLIKELETLSIILKLLCPNSTEADIDYIENGIAPMVEGALHKISRIDVFIDLETMYFEKGEDQTKLFVIRLKKSYLSTVRNFVQYYNKNTFEKAKHEAFLYKTEELKQLIYKTHGILRTIIQEIKRFADYYLGNKPTANMDTTELLSKNLTNFLEEPLFDVIDVYFSTFDSLHLSLMEFIMNYNTKNDIYSDTIEGDDLMFVVDTNIVKKRIAKEVLNNCNVDIIKNYITDKYNTLKLELVAWGDKFHEYKEFVFSILESYVKATTPKKALFFIDLLSMVKNEDIPKQPTIGEYYNKIMQELETGYNEIIKLFTANSKPNNNDQETPQQALYFTHSFTDKERENLFNGLISGGFIPKDSNYNHFSFVFGGAETTDFQPLKWCASVTLLGYFIDMGFADTDNTNIWEKTKYCFTINGKELNTNSIKNSISKLKGNGKYLSKPKNSDKIDTILSNL